MGPLEGYRVIDLTVEENTAICSSLLVDFGAEVICIHSAEPQVIETRRGYMDILRRGTKSVCLDIFTETGADLFRKIAATADVVICNEPNEKLERFGLDYENLKAVNPKLVFASTSSYGVIGQTDDDDLLAMADSGIMYTTGDADGAPIAPGFNAGSHWVGMSTIFAILSGLVHAHNSGEGVKLEIAMRDALFNICECGVFTTVVFHQKFRRNGNHDTGVSPYGVFRAKDGYLAISVISEGGWKKFTKALGREDMMEDPRFITFADRVANTADLIVEIEKFTGARTKLENQKYFLECGISCGPVYTMEEALAGEQLNSREMIQTVDTNKYGPIKMANLAIKTYGTPGQLHSVIPEFGADTEHFLAQYRA